MWRWVLGFVLALLILAVGFFYYSLRAVSRAVEVFKTEVYKGEPVFALLGEHLEAINPQAVALRSGGQWYLITDVNAALTTRFAYRKTGFFGAVLGMGTCKTEQERVAIEPLVNGIIERRVDSCAGAETDIADLVALATPVDEVLKDQMPLVEWQALDAQVRADKALQVANYSEREMFDYRCTSEFPYVWDVPDDPRAYVMIRYDEAVTAALAPAFAASGPHDLWIDNGYASDYVMAPAEGQTTSEEGWPVETPFTYMSRDKLRRKIPGVSLYRPKVIVQGERAVCDALVQADFAALWQGDRDIAQLETAWAAGVDSDPSVGAQKDWAAIVNSGPVIAAPAQNLFPYRYFRLR